MPDFHKELSAAALTLAEQTSLQGLLASWPRWQLAGRAVLSQPPTLVAKLNGGLNHLTFKAACESQAFALRLNQPRRRALAMSLEQELRLLGLASEHGLAPEVLFSEGDWLVSRFIDTPSWEEQIDQSIEPLAQQLHALHRLEISDTGFNLVEHCRGYFANLHRPSASQQQLHQRLLDLTQTTLTDFPARCLCHNDLSPGNIMLSATPLLIDWEYACSNHPAFDLASLLEWGQLSSVQQQRLLSAYQADEQTAATNPECLRAFRLIVRYVEWLWLLQVEEQDEEQVKGVGENLIQNEAQICQHRLEQVLASEQGSGLD